MAFSKPKTFIYTNIFGSFEFWLLIFYIEFRSEYGGSVSQGGTIKGVQRTRFAQYIYIYFLSDKYSLINCVLGTIDSHNLIKSGLFRDFAFVLALLKGVTGNLWYLN